jgi:hypothetical protein
MAMEQMTWPEWQKMSHAEKERRRDNSELSQQLIGKEGWRVEVVTRYGERRRFIVGRSTGWKPIHLEVKTRRSLGGMAAESDYASVRMVEKVR